MRRQQQPPRWSTSWVSRDWEMDGAQSSDWDPHSRLLDIRVTRLLTSGLSLESNDLYRIPHHDTLLLGPLGWDHCRLAREGFGTPSPWCLPFLSQFPMSLFPASSPDISDFSACLSHLPSSQPPGSLSPAARCPCEPARPERGSAPAVTGMAPGMPSPPSSPSCLPKSFIFFSKKKRFIYSWHTVLY